MGYSAKAVFARQELSFFLCNTLLFFIIVAMRKNRNFFEDRQADSGVLCAGAVLVLAHPILCATLSKNVRRGLVDVLANRALKARFFILFQR